MSAPQNPENIAILGFDREGQASYEYFTCQPDFGGQVTICDQDINKVIPDGADAVLGDSYLDNLDRFDLLVRTPGLKPSLILDKNPDVAGKITSGTNEFFKVCPTSNIIGVTGTKGKGTTSTLITKMLEGTLSGRGSTPLGGKTVHLGGNIGVPALSFLSNISADDWVVLELSSFQLIDIESSPHIAVCLMVAAEHLDWHKDLEEYITAKEQLFARQLPGDVAIYYYENELSKHIAAAGEGQKVAYCHSPGAEVIDGTIIIDGNVVCQTSELQLLGAHNWQNACAAITAVWYTMRSVAGPADRPASVPDLAAIRSVLTSFTGLEHRLEFVRELAGVKYYDDSFGTTPETAIVALQAFAGPKVIILGGSDKGASYEELAKVVNSTNVRQALLIGDQAPRIQAALESAGFTAFSPGGDTMEAIVNNAARFAQSGDIVLLSTGCASFGMFQNYKDRGDQFKQAVQALPSPATTV